MKHEFKDPDLIELDRIWPLGQQLVVPENGTIVVAGAYEGRYIHYLNEMFPTAHIVGYEPQYAAYFKAFNRFIGNQQVELRNYGFATSERDLQLGIVGTDGASSVAFRGPNEQCSMANIVEELQLRAHQVDLFVMNCEGSEWALLPYLLDEMMHHRIASMAIQFHPEYVSHKQSQRVVDYLTEYYDISECNDYPTWTYWKRKAA